MLSARLIPPTSNDYRAAARRLYERGGVIEIEEFAQVEDSDQPGGLWVEAWVWVPDAEAAKGATASETAAGDRANGLPAMNEGDN